MNEVVGGRQSGLGVVVVVDQPSRSTLEKVRIAAQGPPCASSSAA
jgi:hypothetical protein